MCVGKKLKNIAPNVLRLCVCLPLAQGFNLPQMLMGQIAQNRCYLLVRIITAELELERKRFLFSFLCDGKY